MKTNPTRKSAVSKIIPDTSVSDMGMFSRQEVRDMPFSRKKEIGLIMSNGEINDYRYYQIIGQGGSYKEESWNKIKHRHDCCKSKVAWRHKTGCKQEMDMWPDDLSDLKEKVDK